MYINNEPVMNCDKIRSNNTKVWRTTYTQVNKIKKKYKKVKNLKVFCNYDTLIFWKKL